MGSHGMQQLLKISGLYILIGLLISCGTSDFTSKAEKKSHRSEASDDLTMGRPMNDRDSGQLNLSLPIASKQFADVAYVEIHLSSTPSTSISIPESPYCRPMSRASTPTGTGPGAESSIGQLCDPLPVAIPFFPWEDSQTLPFKSGQKIKIQGVAVGIVQVEVRLLNQFKKLLFMGSTYTSVAMNQTATATVEVYPVAVDGGVDITIKPGDQLGNATAENAVMPGGYRSVSPDDNEVKKAAAFAVSQLGSYKLLAIKKASRQSVAGSNYKMTLSITNGSTTKDVEVVVYKSLSGTMSLIGAPTLGN